MAVIRVAAALVATFGAGCASYASRATARPAGAGTTTVAISADAVAIEHGREYTVLPAPDVSVRRGMSDRWDLGVRIGAGSVESAATILVADAPCWAIALVPNVGLGFAPITNNGTDVLRAHAGARGVWERDLSARVALATSLGARLTATGPVTVLAGDSGESRLLIEPSASLGLRIRARGRIVWPEVSLVLPIDPTSGAERPAIAAGIGLEL